jgi:error-prone DNA polymerase
VEVREVSVAESSWDSTLEKPSAQSRIESTCKGANRALRLGFRLIKGVGEDAGRSIEAARAERHFSSLDDLVRRARLKKNEVEALAEAGALEPLVPDRRHALWKARAPRTGGLFKELDSNEPDVRLPRLRQAEQLLLDYGRKGLSVSDHPMCHLRARMDERGVVTTASLVDVPQGRFVRIAGLVLTRQRPGTASGVVFITLEDETGVANLILYAHIFEKFRLAARHATLLLVRGKVERHVTQPQPGQVGAATPIVHVVVGELERLDIPGRQLSSQSRDFH